MSLKKLIFEQYYGEVNKFSFFEIAMTFELINISYGIPMLFCKKQIKINCTDGFTSDDQ